jgi:hypothetical protein
MASEIAKASGVELGAIDQAKEMRYKLAKFVNKLAKTNTRAELDEKLKVVTSKIKQSRSSYGKS